MSIEFTKSVGNLELPFGREFTRFMEPDTFALPLLCAVNRRHGPIALGHFDAHLDPWDTYMSTPYTHGTPFRRATEEGLFIEDHSMHVGISGSIYDADDLTSDAGLGFSIVGA